MAKKEEQIMSVEEKLRALYELQTVDTKIDELRILAGELPQEVKDMSDEVEGLKTRLTNIENSIKECETGISEHRVRIENANAAIALYLNNSQTIVCILTNTMECCHKAILNMLLQISSTEHEFLCLLLGL